MKIGIDMVSCKRFKKFLKNHSCYENVFTKNEIDNITNAKKSPERASGYFAVKEAVLKCFGLGILNGVKLTDIEIIYSNTGKPEVVMNAKIKKYLKQFNCDSLEISISHEKEMAVAIAVIC